MEKIELSCQILTCVLDARLMISIYNFSDPAMVIIKLSMGRRWLCLPIDQLNHTYVHDESGSIGNC